MALLRITALIFLLAGLWAPLDAHAVNVSFNTSEHGSFARLHFIWPSEVFYRTEINDSELIVTFADVMDGDPALFAQNLPAYIKSVTKDADGHKLLFTLNDAFEIRSFANGNTIFIDLVGKTPIMTPPRNNAPQPLVPAPAEKTESLPPSPEAIETPPLTVIHPTESVTIAPTAPLEEKEVKETASPTVAPIAPSVPVTVADAAPTAETKITPMPTPVAAAENNPPTTEVEPAPLPAPEVKETKETTAPTEAKENDETKKAEDMEPEPSESFIDEIKSVKKTSSLLAPLVTLSFPQKHIVPTAVFKRNGYLWVVFNSAEPVDINLLRRLGGKIVKEIIQFPSQTATIIRILMPAHLNPSVRREGTLLILDIKEQDIKPNFSLDIRPQSYAGLGTRLFIPVTGAAKPVTINDPSVGDSFQVVPVIPLGRGIDGLRQYPEADILPSAQGVVLAPRADFTEARTSNSGIEIVRRGKDFLVSKVDLKPALRNDVSDSLNIKDWGYVDAANFTEQKHKMQTLPFLVDADKKDLARLEVARFMFVNEQLPEAAGILHLVANDTPSLTETRAFKALSGVVNFMLGRFKEAEEYLFDPMLDNDDEVALWRAAVKTYTGKPEDGISVLKANMGTLKDYPAWIRNKLGFTALKAAAAANDDLAIQNLIELVNNDETSIYQLAGLDYYRGKMNQMTAAYSAAIDDYTKAENGRSRYFDALAGLEKTKLQMELGILSFKEAAENLERHRFAWREDDYESELLSLLVKLYLENKEYGKAMRTMRDISGIFGNTDIGTESAAHLSSLFLDLFLKDKANEVSPLKAIALFEEFKELTPPDESGNEIMRKLADRMVSVDLLEQAQELLENQLKISHSNPREKVLIGTRLALVDLLNRKPQSALEALDLSEDKNISSAMQTRRTYIRAKALADIGNAKEALQLLENDSSEEANALKTEILWKEKRWSEAADMMKKFIKKPKPKQPLSDEQARTIMYWTTAMKLAGEDMSVAIARKNFLPYMRNTKYFNGFNLISSDKPVGVMDYKTISSEIKTVENFRNFAHSYSQELKNAPLSQLIQ